MPDNQPPIDSPMLTPQGRRFSKKFLLIIILALILAAGAYGAVWWWGNQHHPIALYTITHRPSLSVSPTPDTSTWKTYTNTQFGFSFRYPSFWTQQQTTNSVTLIYGPGSQDQGGVFINEARITFSGYSKLTPDITSQTSVTTWKNSESFSEANFKGVIIYDTTLDINDPERGNWIKAYATLPNGNIVILDWLGSGSSGQDVFDYHQYLLPVLSTFQFTK